MLLHSRLLIPLWGGRAVAVRSVAQEGNVQCQPGGHEVGGIALTPSVAERSVQPSVYGHHSAISGDIGVGTCHEWWQLVRGCLDEMV